MFNLDELGGRIRERRLGRGLKQEDIARALQISPQAVSKWERGENGPDLATLAPLSKLLGVSVDWILGATAEDTDVFDASVFASSLRGAFKKSHDMDPRSFATWANGVFSQLTDTVLRFDGVPIKYVGDGFLCFFSGVDHRQRALRATLLAKNMVGERLVVGLSSGDIYLGAMGHPDYARPDVMGVTVNLAFLTMGWADGNCTGGLAATAATFEDVENVNDIAHGPKTEVTFKDIDEPVMLVEIELAGET